MELPQHGWREIVCYNTVNFSAGVFLHFLYYRENQRQQLKMKISCAGTGIKYMI